MKTILAKMIWDVNESLATLAVSKAIAESRRLCKSHGTVLPAATVIHRVREAAERELALHDHPRARTRQVFGPERPVHHTDWRLPSIGCCGSTTRWRRDVTHIRVSCITQHMESMQHET